MKVGSCCGAAYLQAETAFVSVRTGTAEQPDVVQPNCLTFVVNFWDLMPSVLLQTDGSEPNKLVIMNADVVKVGYHGLPLAINICERL